MNKKVNKGFTLAELLVVVAIIAVLVAIAIPVFSTQLEKAREATDLANIRSAYAEIMTAVATRDDDVDESKPLSEDYNLFYALKNNPNVYLFHTNWYQYVALIEIKQTKNGWQNENAAESIKSLFGEEFADDFNEVISQIEMLNEYIKENYDGKKMYCFLIYEISHDRSNNPWLFNIDILDN